MKEVKDIIIELHKIGAIKFGEFILKSGKKSPYYIDLRILPSYPPILRKVGILMAELIRKSAELPTRICGVPLAGLAIATVVGLESQLPVIYLRKEPMVYKDITQKLRTFLTKREYTDQEKLSIQMAINFIEELGGFKTHGIKRYIDGEINNGDKIGIVDDLITTADSKLEAIELIQLEAKSRNLDVVIDGIYVFLDREEGGKEALEKLGFKLYYAIKITDVMEILCQEDIIEKALYEEVMKYIERERMKG